MGEVYVIKRVLRYSATGVGREVVVNQSRGSGRGVFVRSNAELYVRSRSVSFIADVADFSSVS